MGNIYLTEKILSYIEDHLEEELSLKKIADECHYSKSYLARTFKKHTGQTLYKYIQCRRLDEAARKLAKTRRPVIEIALEAGYSSQQAFTQAFHDAYAYTPQAYRKRGVYLSKQHAVIRSITVRSRSPKCRIHAFQTEGGLAA